MRKTLSSLLAAAALATPVIAQENIVVNDADKCVFDKLNDIAASIEPTTSVEPTIRVSLTFTYTKQQLNEYFIRPCEAETNTKAYLANGLTKYSNRPDVKFVFE